MNFKFKNLFYTKEMNNCEYCNKSFSTKSNLSNHKKTAKYCLIKQKKNITNEYKCVCSKSFISNKVFNKHKETCNFNNIIIPYIEKNETENKLYLQKIENENKIYLEQLEKKDIRIKELENKLENIALAGVKKSTTTNNISNKILNISPLDINDIDKFKNILENKLDTNYILDGQKGIAHFVKDHFLKDEDGKLKYVCTDPGRQTFKYKDESGEMQKDIKAKKLTKTIIDSGVKEKNNNIAIDWWTKENGKINTDRFIILQPKTSEIQSMTEIENTLFVNELSAITSL